MQTSQLHSKHGVIICDFRIGDSGHADGIFHVPIIYRLSLVWSCMVSGIHWLAIDNSTRFGFASLLVRGPQSLLGWLALKKTEKTCSVSWTYFEGLGSRPWQLCNCRDSICSCLSGSHFGWPPSLLFFLYLRNAHVHKRMKQRFISIAALWATAASVPWQQAVQLVFMPSDCQHHIFVRSLITYNLW